jgi:hypothetical protein
MEGRAMLTDDAIRGVKKAAAVEATNAARLSSSFIIAGLAAPHPDFRGQVVFAG